MYGGKENSSQIILLRSIVNWFWENFQKLFVAIGRSRKDEEQINTMNKIKF